MSPSVNNNHIREVIYERSSFATLSYNSETWFVTRESTRRKMHLKTVLDATIKGYDNIQFETIYDIMADLGY